MPFRNQDIFIGHSESFWRALLPKLLHGTARREKSRPCECSRGPALPVWTSSELFIRSLTDVGWWVLARSQCSSSSQRFWMGLKSGLCAGQFYTTQVFLYMAVFVGWKKGKCNNFLTERTLEFCLLFGGSVLRKCSPGVRYFFCVLHAISRNAVIGKLMDQHLLSWCFHWHYL